jgi:hypothetical protein
MKQKQKIIYINSMYYYYYYYYMFNKNRLCGLVVRVPGYRSRGLGSIPGATRCSEK